MFQVKFHHRPKDKGQDERAAKENRFRRLSKIPKKRVMSTSGMLLFKP